MFFSCLKDIANFKKKNKPAKKSCEQLNITKEHEEDNRALFKLLFCCCFLHEIICY